jgi:hypothetical protein
VVTTGPKAPPRAFCLKLESSFIDYNSTLSGSAAGRHARWPAGLANAHCTAPLSPTGTAESGWQRAWGPSLPATGNTTVRGA